MEQNKRTRELLISHYKTYPKLQIQDILKFLFQSAFGCEHMMSAPDNLINHIKQEHKTTSTDAAPVVEPLDGEYCRVHLSCLNEGLSADTLGSLFFFSVGRDADARSALQQKLNVAKELICEGLLPFSAEDFEKAVSEWEKKGYPALHHSSVFRETYHPAYRVIAKEYVPFLPLFAELDKRLAKTRGTDMVKVAIDGGSAGGKSTLGELLTVLYECTLFHTDDFFLRPQQRTPARLAQTGGNFDRERFISEVLKPMEKDETILYRRFDCSTMTIEEPEYIIPEKLVVIEGVYSMHPRLAKYYDFSVFLDIDPDLQRERILDRNSPEMAKRYFEQWIPMENKYFSAFNIKEQCDINIKIQ